jgi:hypothetical protein
MKSFREACTGQADIMEMAQEYSVGDRLTMEGFNDDDIDAFTEYVDRAGVAYGMMIVSNMLRGEEFPKYMALGTILHLTLLVGIDMGRSDTVESLRDQPKED